MLSSKLTNIMFKEFIFMFMGLFIITAIAEINKPHVVIRIPSEFFLIAFYSFSFYFIILSIRVIFWAIKKYLFSCYHGEAYSITMPSRIKKKNTRMYPRFSGIKFPKGKIFKIVRPLYALQKIRSLF